MLRLGLISDSHGDANITKRLLKKIEKQKVDAIAVLGDLGDDFKAINSVLKSIRAKVPVIAFPGSHEPLKDFNSAIKKHKRIIDGTKKRKIRIKGHDIVTMPGSNVHPHDTGFMLSNETRIPAEYLKRYRFFFTRMLGKLVGNPAKTIVLAHNPPHCSTPKGIDAANSGIATKGFMIKHKHIKLLGEEFEERIRKNPLKLILEKGRIVTQPRASIMARLGYPVRVGFRNVGFQALGKALRKNKIKFFACGHIHEAGQRAIMPNGMPVKEGKPSKAVWYNVGPAKEGKCGILVIDGDKGYFKNIRA